MEKLRNETEKAWAAGFWDGEGCAYLAQVGEGGKYKYLSLSLGQCYDPSTLERFARAVDHGNVTGPHSSGHRDAPTWKWRATGGPAEKVVSALWPYLSDVKRAQIEDIRTKTGRMSSGEAEE